MRPDFSNQHLPEYTPKLRTMLMVGLSVLFGLTLHQPVFAQSPSTWQQGATGLRMQSNADKKTAGLTITVQDDGWPFLSLQGGVLDEGYSMIGGPFGVELGLAKIPSGTSSAFSSETADWAGDQATFNSGTSNQMDVWTSRLSPAILLRTTDSTLRLFAGNVNTYVPGGNKSAPSFPKYVAFSSGGKLQVSVLSSSPVNLPTLDSNWILIWYGANSHFHDTKVPILYPYPSQKGCCSGDGSVPMSQGYQADAPLLIIFQNAPSSIAQSPEGGIDLNFSSGAGYTTILPPLGREHLPSTITESWAGSGTFPADVSSKITFWVQHLCSYPSDASESYSYDNPNDTVNITENIIYIPVCAGGATGTTFAPIPPMLGIASNALRVSYSISGSAATLVNGDLPTEFGPSFGVERTNTYTWSITGLRKYTDSNRVVTNTGQAPPELVQMLTSQVDKITTAGHFAPWIFENKWSYNAVVGDVYWLDPADNIYVLSEIIPALPEPQKTNLTNYLKSERATYPPETVYDLTLYQGTLRQDYNPPNQSVGCGQAQLSSCWTKTRSELHMTRVWLYNFFALSRYYGITGEAIPSSVMTAALATLDKDMSQQDWATMYWFKGFDDRRIPVVNANRHLAGLIGLVKLAKQTGDSNTESLGRSVLAKAAVARIAMAAYPRYLYANDLVTLPSDPSWQPKSYAQGHNDKGIITNYNWTAPSDDARQVTTLDQFGLTIYDSSGFYPRFTGSAFILNTVTDAYLVAFKDMVPEVALLLSDSAKADADIYPAKLEATLPQWYKAYSDAILGTEHGVAYPIDSYQIFMAKAWIDNSSAQTLNKYIDIPWLSSGDFFYVHKLAETIKAYQGIIWQ